MTTKINNETKTQKLNLRRESLGALTTTNLEQNRGGCSANTGRIFVLSRFTK